MNPDREKLARVKLAPCDRAKLRLDLFNAARAEPYWLDELERIAIAYADRRVAEALEEVVEIIDQERDVESIAYYNIYSRIGDLSPAHEGGEP